MNSNTLHLSAQRVWPRALSQRPKRVSKSAQAQRFGKKKTFSFPPHQPALSTSSVPCTTLPGFNGCVVPDAGQDGSSASCTKQHGTVFYS